MPGDSGRRAYLADLMAENNWDRDEAETCIAQQPAEGL